MALLVRDNTKVEVIKVGFAILGSIAATGVAKHYSSAFCPPGHDGRRARRRVGQVVLLIDR
ncbi:hypothetical protein I3J27_33530 [Bradyrhizobium xenonodulans]|uniref:Uncharacterized protein n=1 Tax=Bradyrhizobium xenonodulans TaxID=2736875 RepID=A0ABY7MKG2_9BRAD|nr:hypothetical protein [Bradyrhizobium xenonodulans]WBL77862.1 hypothetical protein I3J27_33530 [Bradyrhizobium xenonodulans]